MKILQKFETNTRNSGNQIKSPEPSGQKIRFLYLLLILAVIAVVVGLVYQKAEEIKKISKSPAGTNQITSVNTDAGREPQSDKAFVLQKVFSHVGLNNLYPDPADRHYIWLASPGVILRYNMTTLQYDKIFTGKDVVDDFHFPLLVVKNGFLYYGAQNTDIFRRMEISSGKIKTYKLPGRMMDVNSYLHELKDDPASDLIWIIFKGLNKGLAKFDTRRESFAHALETKENMENLVVDNDYVWFTINPGGLSKGGVGRYDKRSGAWRTWGPEAFGKSDYIAFSNLSVSNDRIFARGGNPIYTFDPDLDKWKVVYNDGYSFRSVEADGNWLYITTISGGIKRLNLATQRTEEVNLPKPRQGLYWVLTQDSRFHRIFFTTWPPRLAVQDTDTDSGQTLLLPVLDDLRVQFVTAVGSGHALMLGESRQLWDYDFDSRRLREVKGIHASDLDYSDYRGSAAELARGKIFGSTAIIYIPWRVLYVIDMISPRVLHRLSLPEKDGNFNVAVGKDTSEIFLLLNQGFRDAGPREVKRYNPATNKLENTTLSEEKVKSQFHLMFQDTDKFSVFDPRSGYRVSPTSFSSTESITELSIKTPQDKEAVPVKITVGGEVPPGAGGVPPRVDVRALAFDDTDQNMLWIGTDRGLVRYDLRSTQSTTFTSADGLVSSSITSVGSSKDFLVVGHYTGIYVYRKNFAK